MKRTIQLLGLVLAAFGLVSCEIDEVCEGNEASSVKIANSATGYDFYIDSYEASRSNAAADTSGNGLTLACNYGGSLPWVNVSFNDAYNACADAGKRLCTYSEWMAACGRRDGYFYGDEYSKGKCNDSGSVATTGGHSACKTSSGVYDLSGNVREWVMSDSNDGTAWLMGGSYNDEESALRCGGKPVANPAGTSSQASVGFRCCSDVTPGLL